MRVFFADHHELPLPAGHRFPIRKYRMLRERLISEEILSAEELFEAPLVERSRLVAVHDPSYVEAVFSGSLDRRAVGRMGFPWSEGLVRRSCASVGGTLAAARAALEDGISGTLAGGTHHALRDAGAGYCVFNDLAVTARALIDDGLVERVLVLDLDVHQGDGTAAIFAGDERVFTCSVHGARNFPARKTESDLDIPLPDDTGDRAYLEAVEHALEASLARSNPDILLYQAGVDPLVDDRLGRLAVSSEALFERDRLVLERSGAEGLPVALTMGGGYADPIDLTVDAHVGTYRAVRDRMPATSR